MNGRLVVTRDEAARVGVTSGLVLDEAVGRITALTFRQKRRSPELWVPTSEVVSVGPDLVVISTADKIHEDPNEGRRLSDCLGLWVTTVSGNHIGRLANVGTRGRDWGVNILVFEDGSCVEIDGTELVFGRDEILTPDRFEALVTTTDSTPGIAARVVQAGRDFFGTDGSTDAGDAESPETTKAGTKPGPVLGPQTPKKENRDQGAKP
jgi:sporulation protein YlmC with PRC-barrel domain